jgi:hydroxymethylpyrimidine/phosphomethylpyrimidine kinase
VSVVKTALTIAGSDPSGGAGIQADLKTFSRLRVYGLSVITALTAQNTSGVVGVMEVSPSFIASQLDAVLTDIRVDAVKTGMLSSAGTVEVVAEKMKQYQVRNLVVDPVIASTSGTSLLDREAIGTLSRTLLPLALVVTPNRHEAEILTGKTMVRPDDMEEAALQLHALGARFVLIKGGHWPGSEATDLLFDGKGFSYLRADRIQSPNTHGTGCVLSAAITAELATGKGVHEAVQQAKLFITQAIRNGLSLGKGHGPCDPLGLGNWGQ